MWYRKCNFLMSQIKKVNEGPGAKLFCLLIEKGIIFNNLYKVGPVDNRPSTD